MESVCVKGEGLSRIQELKRNLSFALQDSSWDDALSVLEKLVELEGSQPAYHNQIGDIFLKSGRREAAMDSFMRGIEAYRDLGMLPNGAALCKKVLRLDPDQRDAVWYLGELKTRQGFLADGAEKVLEGLRIYAEDPDYPKTDMLEKLGTAESLQAGSRDVLEFVATSYARMNESERARSTTLRIADLEEREGKADKAVELRQLAREMAPDAPGGGEPGGGAPPDEPRIEAAPQKPEPISVTMDRTPPVESLMVTSPQLDPVMPPEETPEIEPPIAEEAEPDIEIESPPELGPLVDVEPLATMETLTVTAPEEPTDTAPEAPRAGETAPVVEETVALASAAPQESEPAIMEVSELEPDVLTEPEPEPDPEPDPVVELSTNSLADGMDEASAPPEEAEPEPEPEKAEDDETARLAASMLELMGGDDGDLPDVEMLGEGETEEDLLTTRQVIDTLSIGLQGEDEVEILREEPEREFNVIPPPPSASVDRAPEPEPDIAEVMLSEPTFESVDLDDLPVPEEPKAVVQDANAPISFDLSTTAEEALQTDDIHEVVGEFKRRMKEHSGLMAAEERYQLGVSYMEMGLFSEALDEFEYTLEDRVLGAKTREWMARCLLALDRPREIVLLLQTSLDAETYPHKSMVELYFILGEAYVALKAWDLALDAFTKVYQLDPGFRDVQARLAKLTTA